MTYPLMGNYGVCEDDYESDRIQVRGFVTKYLCKQPHNWRSSKTLNEFLREFGVPGIEGIDTRMLVKKARDNGTMKAVLMVSEDKDLPSKEEIMKKVKRQQHISEIDFMHEVSEKTVKFIDVNGKHDVVLIDCGAKKNIIRQLALRNVNLHIVPYDFSAEKIMEYKPDGVFVSNGPGDPENVKPTIETIRSITGKVPIAGICLGLQLIGLSFGAETFKLKFGHRGANHPVKDIETGRVFISTQNHGFSLQTKSLNGTGLEMTQFNLNDGTVEGIKHKELPIVAVQYHPEASPGPHDTHFFFDKFVKML